MTHAILLLLITVIGSSPWILRILFGSFISFVSFSSSVLLALVVGVDGIRRGGEQPSSFVSQGDEVYLKYFCPCIFAFGVLCYIG